MTDGKKILQLEARHKQSLTTLSATKLLETRKHYNIYWKLKLRPYYYLKRKFIMKQVTKQVDFSLEP